MMWKIATQVRPDDSVSRYQVMLALLRTNPHAFDIPCNLNSLKVGETLKIPPVAEMKALSERAAVEEYKQQVEAWKNRRNNPINCPPITADVETEKAAETEAKIEAETQKVAATAESQNSKKEEQNQKTTTEAPEDQEKTEPVEATSPAPATEESAALEAQQQTQKNIKIPPPSVSALVDSGEVSESEGSESAPITTELSTESSEANPSEAEMTQPPATETESPSPDAAEPSDAPLTETADEPVALVRDTPPAPAVIDTEQQETAVASTDSPPSEGLMASTLDEIKRVILELPQTLLILLGVGLLISIIIISILLYVNRKGGRKTTKDSEPIQEMPLHPSHKTE
ncbi:MAG: FimV/HubP family polar landmark protein [Pseudomonadota bacterium]|nr:FimV/HubP family polar landmark protein [Pseudomonadota bacterium]